MTSSIADAINFARSRGVVLPFEYYNVLSARDRAMAFSIAGQIDIAAIQNVKELLDNALAEGQTFQQWQDAIREKGLLQAYEPHRLENIFRTNVQLAYSAGRCRPVANARTPRDYLMYSAVGGRQGDGRTRKSHAARHGTILHRDHEWWQTNTPSIDYQCRCTVIQLTEKQAIARGGITESPPEIDDGFGYSVCHDGAEEGLKRSIIDMNNRCSTLNSRPIWCGNEQAGNILSKQTEMLNNYNDPETIARRIFSDYDDLVQSDAIFATHLASGIALPYVVAINDYHEDSFLEIDQANRDAFVGKPLGDDDEKAGVLGDKIGLIDQFIKSQSSVQGEYYIRIDTTLHASLIERLLNAYVMQDELKLHTHLTAQSSALSLSQYAGNIDLIIRSDAVLTHDQQYIVPRETSFRVQIDESKEQRLTLILTKSDIEQTDDFPDLPESLSDSVSELAKSQSL